MVTMPISTVVRAARDRVGGAGLAFDVRHDGVEQGTARRSAPWLSRLTSELRLTRVEERQDVRMAEARGRLDLAQEPLRPEGGGQFWPQHLHGDQAAVSEVLGEVDSRHAARTELPFDPVAVAEGGCDLPDHLRHAVLMCFRVRASANRRPDPMGGGDAAGRAVDNRCRARGRHPSIRHRDPWSRSRSSVNQFSTSINRSSSVCRALVDDVERNKNALPSGVTSKDVW